MILTPLTTHSQKQIREWVRFWSKRNINELVGLVRGEGPSQSSTDDSLEVIERI